MKLPGSRKWGALIAMGGVMGALGSTVASPAHAFTRADADAAVDAYLKAFVQRTGTTAFIKGDQNGGDPGFWQEVEEIEGIEDANDRTRRRLQYPGRRPSGRFQSRRTGPTGPDNIYNDDIAWAAIAYTRGYLATKNTAFLDYRQGQLRPDVRPRLEPRQRLRSTGRPTTPATTPASSARQALPPAC